MKIEAISHSDVQGKIMLYLRIENAAGDTTYVNIGQKTYDKVNELTEKEQKLQKIAEQKQPKIEGK